MSQISRRRLIKKAGLAGAALAVSPMIFVPRAKAAWERKSIVHPNVDNLGNNHRSLIIG
jgi:hypothetical protein